jgi:hypothetical protein
MILMYQVLMEAVKVTLRSNFRGLCLESTLCAAVTTSLLDYLYQKDERAKSGNFLIKRCSFFFHSSGAQIVLCQLSVLTKRATVSLIKVKSCNALLRMLLECITSYLKSVL